MKIQEVKPKENKSRAVANAVVQEKRTHQKDIKIDDKRTSGVRQAQIADIINSKEKRNNHIPALPIQCKNINIINKTNTGYIVESEGKPSDFAGGGAAPRWPGVSNTKLYQAEYAATDQLNIHGIRTGRGKQGESAVMDNFIPEFASGHLLPSRLGGQGSRENSFWQEGGQNTGSWTSFENEASQVCRNTPESGTFKYRMTLAGDNLEYNF